MDRVCRVRRAIRGEPADRPPRGELRLGPHLAARIAGAEAAAAGRLGFDFYGVVAPAPGPRARVRLCETVRSLRERTDLFLFVVVGGCFSDLAGALGWQTFLRLVHTDPGRLAAWGRRRSRAWTGAALEAVQAGAHGVVVADDLAHRDGTFASPPTLRRYFFPLLADMVRQIRDQVPVFLHSDGNLATVLPDIVAMGFDGLHPLEPGPGMTPARAGEATRWRLALAGGIDPGVLAAGGEAAMRRAVRRALPPRERGRYLAGTAWGFLDDSVDPDRLLALYRLIAEETAG